MFSLLVVTCLTILLYILISQRKRKISKMFTIKNVEIRNDKLTIIKKKDDKSIIDTWFH